MAIIFRGQTLTVVYHFTQDHQLEHGDPLCGYDQAVGNSLNLLTGDWSIVTCTSCVEYRHA